MMEHRHNSSPLAWRRPLFALLAGLALAFGMAVPHDEAVEQAGMVSKVEVAETAVHPGDPAHFESAELKIHPGCMACLLQLGSSTVLGPSPALPLPLPPDRNLAVAVERASSGSISLLGPARAPPISSPSA